MDKIKLLTTFVTAIMIISLAVNVYQWSTISALTSQGKREEMASFLIHDASTINSELQKLDNVISSACQQLSSTGLTGAVAEKVLSDVYTQNSDIIVNVATADKNDILLAVQPSNYTGIIGEDIKNQEQNVEMHQTMRPAVSNLIVPVKSLSSKSK